MPPLPADVPSAAKRHSAVGCNDTEPLANQRSHYESEGLRITRTRRRSPISPFSLLPFPFSPLSSLLVSLVVCALCLAASTGMAQEAPPAGDLNARSLPLRTALHRDPTLVSPLQRLLSMYRDANRTTELVGLYRAHVAQYPSDVSARTVLVRLLAAGGDPEAVRESRGAAAQFPQNAYLHYLLYEILRARSSGSGASTTGQESTALDSLDRAIELETRLGRKVVWIDLLLPAAVDEDRKDLAEKHLRALAELVDEPAERLEVARRMVKYELFAAALELLEKEGAAGPSPEVMVSIELEAAAAEVGLGKARAAGARLDRLLAKLTADYWRRQQIVRRRLSLVDSQAERDAMIALGRKRVEENPRDEAAAMDLAQVLCGLQLRRDAVAVLIEAGRRLPKSTQIERRTLELFDRLRDTHGREEFLAERMRLHPGRTDLVLLHVKTLYLLGRPGEAAAELDGAIKAISPKDQAACLLEMARFLRRSTLVEDSVELFGRVIELDPARLDVRRELAETYLATGRRQEVRKLFAGGASRQASQQADLEDLLDLVQFMIEQELYAEARSAISGRLGQQKDDLDLRLLLLSVERRLGNLAAGEKLIAQSRRLADTGARYRLWLEAAVTLHEDFDSVGQFIQAEQSRLAGDPPQWTTRRLQRRLAFAEIASRNGREDQTAAMLQGDLDSDPPPEFRVALRRQLVAALEKQTRFGGSPQTTDEVRHELEELAKEDRQHADEYRARLALLHAGRQRQDLVVELLAEVDVSRIQDPAVLSSLRPLCSQDPARRRQMLDILQRLTVLSPTQRGNWQEWLTALAASPEETRLRGVLRRLLAGVQKMPLTEQTRALLESHLADSYWRSIAESLTAGRETSLSEAVVQLDAVERMAGGNQQWLWVTWIRAHVLGRLGRQQARDEAIAELARVAAAIVGTPDSADASVLRIAFPDGLSISFDRARELLTADAPPGGFDRVSQRRGPVGELEVRWDFRTGAQAPIIAVVPLGPAISKAERTLICDLRGGAHCLDTASGKLMWTADGILPAMPVATPNSAPVRSGVPMLPGLPGMPTRQGLPAVRPAAGDAVPLADGRGRFFVPAVAEVACHAVDDGRRLWRAQVGAVGAAPPAATPVVPASVPAMRPNVSIFLYRDGLLTYEPISGTVTRIDPATGKIVWDRTFPAEKPAAVSHLNCGASLCGDRLLVYGARTAVVNVESGDLEWSFEPWRVRTFPIELRDPSDEELDAALSAGQYPAAYPTAPYSQPSPAQYVAMLRGQPYPVSGPVSYPGTGYIPPPGQPTVQFVDYLQRNTTGGPPSGTMGLTGAAVAWAASVQQGTSRRAWLTDRALLLMSGQDSLQIVRTDFPLAGKRVSISGRFVGMAGRVMCLVSDEQLDLVDLAEGTTKQYDLGEISSGRLPGVPIQAAVDGPMVYVTGPGGILCVAAITGRRVLKADWPAGVTVAGPDESHSVAEATPQVAGASTYLPPRVLLPAGVSTFALPTPYQPGGASSYFPPVPTPAVSLVDSGVLYATLSPGRIVALSEPPADGR